MKSSAYANLLRWIVFILNFLFWMAGFVVLGVSLWIMFDRGVAQELRQADALLYESFVSVYLLIAVGLAMSLFGFMGCCGALRMSKCLLTSFFILLVIVFCLELACGILAYQHQHEIGQYLEKSMRTAIVDHYGVVVPYTEIYDSIQSKLQCCGVKSYEDWLGSYYTKQTKGSPEIGIGGSGIGRVPMTCCNSFGLQEFGNDCGVTFDKTPLFTYKSYLNTKGCLEAVYAVFHNHLDIVIGLAVGIGCFQLLGMVFTMLLCCWISRKDREEHKAGGY